DKDCPYIGLYAFREGDHKLFFGRARLIQESVGRLQLGRFLGMVGPSGSGKSSIAMGGLLPDLQAGALPGSENWRYFPPLAPGSDPLANLARHLLPDDIAPTQRSDWVASAIAGFRTQPDHLTKLVAQSGAQPYVLLVDQFEEVFTL